MKVITSIINTTLQQHLSLQAKRNDNARVTREKYWHSGFTRILAAYIKGYWLLPGKETI